MGNPFFPTSFHLMPYLGSVLSKRLVPLCYFPPWKSVCLLQPWKALSRACGLLNSTHSVSRLGWKFESFTIPSPRPTLPHLLLVCLLCISSPYSTPSWLCSWGLPEVVSESSKLSIVSEDFKGHAKFSAVLLGNRLLVAKFQGAHPIVLVSK